MHAHTFPRLVRSNDQTRNQLPIVLRTPQGQPTLTVHPGQRQAFIQAIQAVLDRATSWPVSQEVILSKVKDATFALSWSTRPLTMSKLISQTTLQSWLSTLDPKGAGRHTGFLRSVE